MFSRALLADLYRHMEWADARVWTTVREATDTDRPLDVADDERLKGLLVHIHVVQRAFLTVWTGGEWMTVFRKPDEFAAVADVVAWARPYYADVHEFIAAASDDALCQPITMPWASQVETFIGRPPGVTTLGDTCFQVSSHTTHHRAQVNLRLRELGTEPPLVDYIGWVWFGRPAADWKGK